MLGQANRMQAMLKWAGAMALATLLGGQSFAQVGPEADLATRVKTSLNLADFKLQRIDAATVNTPGIVTMPLTLDGQSVSIRMALHSLRAPNFKFYTRGAGGALTAVNPPAPMTFRGQIIGQPGTGASASIVQGRWAIQVFDGQNMWWMQPLDGVIAGADSRQYILYKQSDVLPLPGFSCGLSDAEQIAHMGDKGAHAGGDSVLAPGLPNGCLRQAEIACDSDYEYFQYNNFDAAATMADIEAILNGVDFIYRRDCGIAYLETAIIVQTVDPDPYTASGFVAILDEFAAYWDANNTAIPRDVAHLFTGRDIDPGPGGVIGIARLPGVCTATDGYALSESHFNTIATIALRVSLTAHELGHNWNARHCNIPDAAQPCCPVPECGIMCSSLSGCTGSGLFEPCTADTIVAYRDSVTCLGVTAAPVWESSALSPLDVLAGDRFGTSVCVNGNLAIIGSGADDVDNIGTDAGSATIFRFDGVTWVQEEKIHAPTVVGRPADRFGTSVAICPTDHGDVAVVGAYLWDYVNPNQTTQRSSGTAFVFRKGANGWVTEQQLIPIDHSGGDFFGLSVSIDRDLIGIGAEFNDDHGNNSGSAYLYRYSGGTWTQEIKLFPVETVAGDNFGIYIDVQQGEATGPGDLAVVGAWADDDDSFGLDVGSIYVFRKGKTGWTVEQKIIPEDGQADDRFGTSVAVSGNAIIVGSPFSDSSAGTSTGSAYVYRKSDLGWGLEAKLTAADAMMDDQFGFNVAIDGDTAAIGSYLRDSGAITNTGAVYLFRNSGGSWIQDATITGPGMMEDQFGYSVSISGGVVMIGSWLSDNAGPVIDGGSVYIGLPAPVVDCNMNLVPDQCDISLGNSMDINANGIPDECEMLTTCTGDATENGIVDIDDLVVVITHWGACTTCPPSCMGDITMNCVVDIDDIVALVTHWGDCPVP